MGMKKLSSTNTYQASDGTRYTQTAIDRKIRLAKELFLHDFIYENDYHFCQECHKNAHTVRLSVSHIKSVKWCKENGFIELAWSVENFRLLCIPCHARYDNNDVRLGKIH